MRGTVRAEKPWLNEFFAKKYGPDSSFETVLIRSFENQDEIESALEGIDGLIHLVGNSADAAYIVAHFESHILIPIYFRPRMSRSIMTPTPLSRGLSGPLRIS